MAIKLMGVSGDKLMSDEKETQDFILISHPRFFVDDLKPYKATLDRFLRGTFWDQWVVAPLKLGSLRSIAIAFRGRLNARSFGSATCGLSTAVRQFPLANRARLAVVVNVMADRHARQYGGMVEPDESIADPTQVVERAVAWLRQR